ncbi:MATE efflux family protein [Astrocystis sublimbata]|nr:MATE efflux family protein [Astrocystis sublimbata]
MSPSSEARDEGTCEAPSESTPLLADLPKDASKSDADNSRIQYEWTSELKLLAKYSIPLVATYLLQYTYSIIITYVAGRLTTADLAAVSMGITTMNIAGYAIYEGMATALDTLCSQAYGSNNPTGVGLHIQRMLILMIIVSIPIAGIWAASPHILGVFITGDGLADRAGLFLRFSILGIPGYASFEALKRFLQAQGNFSVAMCILLICTPVNYFSCMFFTFDLELGLVGAALGIALTNTLRPILLMIYITSPWGKWSHQCWGGFSRDAWTNWKPVVRLSAAGSLVNLAEWGSFQIVTLSTSWLGTKQMAAQSLLTTISMVTFHIPFSMSIGISTRIGHLIGGGAVDVARRAAGLYAIVFTAIGVIDCVVIYTCHDYIFRFFIKDTSPEVYAIAASTIGVVSLYQIIDAFICFTNGTLRGLGRQSVAAFIVIVLNWVVAVPLALFLEHGPPHWGLPGAWTGIASGMVIVATLECGYMKTLPWDRCVGRVRRQL